MSRQGSRRTGPEALAAYAQPRLGRSMLDLATSVVPYLVGSVLMYLDARRLVPAHAGADRSRRRLSGAHVHRVSRLRARLVPALPSAPTRGSARCSGLLVLSPFLRWRHDHAIHHATSGDLDRRGVGDVHTLTVAEYRALSRRGPPRLPAVPQPAGDVRHRPDRRDDHRPAHRRARTRARGCATA